MKPATGPVRSAALTVVALLTALAASPASGGGDGADERRYADAPEELVPWRGASEPLHRFFKTPTEFRGAGRRAPDTPLPETVRLGVLLPLEGPDGGIGRRVLNGIALAVEDVNAAGGYRGRPFETVIRPDVATWGASSNSLVKMAYDHGVWGVLGSVDGASTHVMLRVALKVEIPIVSTADTDPTLTETRIPWLVRVIPDDRQACYALAKEVFVRRRLRRVAILRTNERYGRMGSAEFADAGRRLGTPMVADLRFNRGGRVSGRVLNRLRAAKPDGILLWGSAREMGKVAAAVRKAGVKAPLFGPSRMLGRSFLAGAGTAAEGATAAMPFDPAASGDDGRQFRVRYRERHGQDPDHHSAYGYDGAMMLMEAIEQAGLNRARIRDELHRVRTRTGVTGPMRFDATMNNLGHTTLATVKDGRFHAPAR